MFASKGLQPQEMVAILGAHTVRSAHSYCRFAHDAIPLAPHAAQCNAHAVGNNTQA